MKTFNLFCLQKLLTAAATVFVLHLASCKGAEAKKHVMAETNKADKPQVILIAAGKDSTEKPFLLQRHSLKTKMCVKNKGG